MPITRIDLEISLDDGKIITQCEMTPDGWQQWGASSATLSKHYHVLEAIYAAIIDARAFEGESVQ